MANFKLVLGFIFILSGVVSSSNFNQDFLQTLKSCDVGDVSENECIRCVCNSNNIYVCTQLNCTNELKEKPNTSQISKEMALKSQTCHPNMVYVHDSVTCICNKNGFWPHKNCDDIFNSLSPSIITKQKCEPNAYVIIDCNVCRCSLNGTINKDRCTTNVCDKYENNKSRRNYKTNHAHGMCEPGNWYSLIACQSCYCVKKNSLVCTTGHENPKALKKVIFGSLSFNICGRFLIQQTIELIPKSKRMSILREGQDLHSITSSIAPAKTENNLEVQETKDITKEISEVNEEKGKYYSKSEEDIQDATLSKSVLRDKGFTRIPFEDEDSVDSENDYNRKDESTDEEANSEKEITIEFVKRISTHKENVITPTEPYKNVYALPKERSKSMKNKIVTGPLKSLSETLKISLPMAINKVLNMALRKSMVSLMPDSNCVPGSSSYIKCNMCFCMKNKKLLCTNNPC